MIGQPEDRKGADDEEDQAGALSFALEHGAAQTADDRGVAHDDEGKGQQAAHDGLKHVLEHPVADAVPVVLGTKSQSDAWRQS